MGVEEPLQHHETYVGINKPLWYSVERGEITPQEVRVTRFERLTIEIGLDANPEHMAESHETSLGAKGDLYPGARECSPEACPASDTGSGHQRAERRAACPNRATRHRQVLRRHCDLSRDRSVEAGRRDFRRDLSSPRLPAKGHDTHGRRQPQLGHPRRDELWHRHLLVQPQRQDCRPRGGDSP